MTVLVFLAGIVGFVNAPADFTSAAGVFRAFLVWLATSPPQAVYGFGAALVVVALAILFWHPEKGWDYYRRPSSSAPGAPPAEVPNAQPEPPPAPQPEIQPENEDPDWAQKLRRVHREDIFNKEVLLDGHSYTSCKFSNVTFLYNGGPFQLVDNVVGPHTIRTDDPKIHRMILLMALFGHIATSLYEARGEVTMDELHRRHNTKNTPPWGPGGSPASPPKPGSRT